jgi:hypothetical protein
MAASVYEDGQDVTALGYEDGKNMSSSVCEVGQDVTALGY